MSQPIEEVTVRVTADTRPADRALRDFSRNAGRQFADLGRQVDQSDEIDRVSTSLTEAASSASSATSALGSLNPAMLVLGGAAVTALPAVSALVPALVGVVGVAGSADLIFGGLSKTISLATEDHKKYEASLKTLNGPQQAFVKAIVSTRQEFTGLGAELQKDVLPTFTAALKNAGPVLDVFKDGLREGADVIKQFGQEANRLITSTRFQDALRKNFSLGAGFVSQLVKPLGDVTQAILDFGAQAGPVLNTFAASVSTLVGTSFPAFLRGLSTGISGSAQLFSGLFSAINNILPAIGELIGAISSGLGPAFGELIRMSGALTAGAIRVLAGAFTLLSPVFNEFSSSLAIVRIGLSAVAQIASNVATVVINSLIPSLGGIAGVEGPVQRLADFFRANQGAITELVRVASQGILSFVAIVVGNLPAVIATFRAMAEVILNSFSVIVSGAAAAFGWIPGIGPQIKAANASFQGFRTNVLNSLSAAEAATNRFANAALPRLRDNRLRLDITNWTRQIAIARNQLSDRNIPPSKRTTLLATISDLQRKVRQANAELNSVARNRTVTVTFRGVFAATSADRNANGVPDSIERRATGGLIRGSGTGTSDSNLILASRGEYVVRAATVRRIGLPAMDALNAGRPAAFQNGGSVQGASFTSNLVSSVRTPAIVQHVTTVSVNLSNQGVIGSKAETLDWLTKSLDILNRRRRLSFT